MHLIQQVYFYFYLNCLNQGKTQMCLWRKQVAFGCVFIGISEPVWAKSKTQVYLWQKLDAKQGAFGCILTFPARVLSASFDVYLKMIRRWQCTLSKFEHLHVFASFCRSAGPWFFLLWTTRQRTRLCFVALCFGIIQLYVAAVSNSLSLFDGRPSTQE